MAKHQQSSIIEPTKEELAMYEQFVKDISDEQMDDLSNEYFDLVQKKQIDVSFPRFLIDKIIRPISPGDTIKIYDENNKEIPLFCLLREEIDGEKYILMCMVDEDTETLIHDNVYIFTVVGTDNIGTEVIDLMPAGELADKVLQIMEDKVNAQLDEEKEE